MFNSLLCKWFSLAYINSLITIFINRPQVPQQTTKTRLNPFIEALIKSNSGKQRNRRPNFFLKITALLWDKSVISIQLYFLAFPFPSGPIIHSQFNWNIFFCMRHDISSSSLRTCSSTVSDRPPHNTSGLSQVRIIWSGPDWISPFCQHASFPASSSFSSPCWVVLGLTAKASCSASPCSFRSRLDSFSLIAVFHLNGREIYGWCHVKAR